jgi:methylenetetrahydrofolate--tRNA-(uracil-5-)-methyltransferase
VAGLNAARVALGLSVVVFPRTTMVGALCHYVSHAEAKRFQPMKPNFGLLPPLAGRRRRKRERYQAYAARAMADLETFAAQHGLSGAAGEDDYRE